MLQSSLLELTRVAVDQCNLLNPRVIIATYNDHLRLLSPGPWLVSATKAYSGVGADIVMESICRFITNDGELERFNADCGPYRREGCAMDDRDQPHGPCDLLD